MKCECGRAIIIIEIIKSDGTSNRPFDKIIGQCPKCKTVINTKYDPRDWYTKRQLKIIEKLMGC